MHDFMIRSGRDTFLVAIPFVSMIFLCIFRFDETLAMPKRALSRRPTMHGSDKDGNPILSDPDGRVIQPRRRLK
jgi:hypothetical protein